MFLLGGGKMVVGRRPSYLFTKKVTPHTSVIYCEYCGWKGGFVAAKIRSKGKGGTHPSFFKRRDHASLRKPTTAKGRGVQD